jgi:hypothetical protein
MHKQGFGQAYRQDLVNMILKKFTLYFLSFILFPMNFRTLKEFPGIFNRIKDFEKDKDVNSAWSYCGPRPSLGLCGPCPRRASARATHDHRARGWHNGVITGGSLVA